MSNRARIVPKIEESKKGRGGSANEFSVELPPFRAGGATVRRRKLCDAMKRLRIETILLGIGAVSVLLVGGCRTPEKRSDADAPPPRPTMAHCASRSEPGVPLDSGPFCLDADTDARSYGARARAPLDGVCTELFNGECELYRRFGLHRVDSFAYVARDDVARRISVVRSDFDSVLGAYGFFQRRVVGDDHPLRATSVPIDVGAGAALGAGVLYARDGASVFELVFTSEDDPPEVIERESKGPLVALARALVAASPVPVPTPRLVEVLTECPHVARSGGPGDGCAGRSRPVPFGVRVEEGLLLGRVRTARFLDLVLESPHRGTFRGLVVEQRDPKAARDLLTEVVRQPLGEKWDSTKTKTIRVTREDAEPEDWVLGVEGRFLVGVGPDSRSARPMERARIASELTELRARVTRFEE